MIYLKSTVPGLLKSAYFSEDMLYRYSLSRTWDTGLSKVNFIGLNPSTADHEIDDPTIRRCMGFAKSWGYGGIIMTNLFAFRATDPSDMKKAEDPLGPENQDHIVEVSNQSRISVACWGKHGVYLNRQNHVLRYFNRLHYLKLNKDGTPAHPLYLPGHLTPQPY